MRKRAELLPPPEHRREPSPVLRKMVDRWRVAREREQGDDTKRVSPTEHQQRALDIVKPHLQVNIERWCKSFTAAVDELKREWENGDPITQQANGTSCWSMPGRRFPKR
jgi:hypothetical protein